MASPLARSTTSSQSNLSDVKEKDYDTSHRNSSVAPTHTMVQDAKTVADIEKTAEASSAESPNPPAGRPYTRWQWFLVCIAIYSSALLYGLDNTIVADIQAAAVETFGEVEKLGWLGIGFPLGSIAIILSLGRIFGLFNVKYVYITSLVMFAAGSALCGGAPSMNALIFGRVWAGAGGAGMYLGVLNIITINTTDRERPVYMSLCGLVWGCGCILGPIIGGSFADSGATWRWGFYINLVIFGVFSPVYVFVLDSYHFQPNLTLKDKIGNLDWVGMFLNACVYTFFVLVFAFAGGQWTWSSGGTIALFVLFGIALIAFIAQQGLPFLTTREKRLFPVDFLQRRTLVLLFITTSAGATGLFVPIYYIPLFFAFTRGDSGVESAVRLLPFIIIVIASTLLNGGLMPKWGLYAPWYLASGVFLTAGGAAMYAVLDAHTSNGAIYGISVIIALGAGLSQQAAYSVAPVKVAPHRIADAIGFINASQIGAIVIALTITSSIFQNVGYRHVASALAGLGFSPDDIHAALAGAKSAVFTSESVTPEIRERVLEGIVKTIGDAYILVIVAGIVTLIASAFMKYERLFMEVGAGA